MASSISELRRCIKTQFLIISDTHGDEFRETIQLLKDIDAPLKLVIASNHDFSLDPPVSERKITAAIRLAQEPLSDVLVKKEFGDHSASRQLLQEAKDEGIVFVDEGPHHFPF
jgi:hypothetical protein